jgi:hypothetical protein
LKISLTQTRREEVMSEKRREFVQLIANRIVELDATWFVFSRQEVTIRRNIEMMKIQFAVNELLQLLYAAPAPIEEFIGKFAACHLSAVKRLVEFANRKRTADCVVEGGSHG